MSATQHLTCNPMPGQPLPDPHALAACRCWPGSETWAWPTLQAPWTCTWARGGPVAADGGGGGFLGEGG